jgi:hypothetical protein
MKKTAMVFMGWNILAVLAFGYDWSTNPGDGTDPNPYQISTPEQLMAMGDDPALMNKIFELTNDIDMDPNITGVPAFTSALIGSDLSPFLGLFWGKYHKIKNLQFNIPAGFTRPVGLFCKLGEGGYNIHGPSAVWMLDIENCTIQAQSSQIGIIAGVNLGTIVECRATGSIEGESYIGGIAGSNLNGIGNSVCDVIISGNLKLGGLVGENNQGVVVDCCARGAITGGSVVGGVAGYSQRGDFQRCYSIAQVGGSSSVGGFLGGAGYSPTIVSCYYLNTAGPNNGKGTPLTAQQMKQKSSYVGWDFAPVVPDNEMHTWRLCQNGSNYPRLFGEFIARGDFSCPDGISTEDLALLAQNWATVSGYKVCDTNVDARIDMQDFMVLSQYWLGD